ncbi:trans-sulfuration enzyme family protein [Rhizobium miluonense]|uniref:Cystathionine beta-lyase n=1 Tax=Rhizobium miluonense TaxID=411945 RepID=A0A1C3WZN7_9HYPH|nr:PLP-dependent transferase [Rhizobium miluonense]SCB45502.1 cystathionine beta-lyase [Rhizobium miluonense]
MRDKTICVKRPKVSADGFASLSTGVHRASTIVFDSAEDYANRAARGPDGYTYGLMGTPTTRALEAAITELEKASRTVLVPSGQAAVSLVFLSVLKPGDTVLVSESAYPPVIDFCEEYLKPRGIVHRLYDPTIGAGITDLFDDTVKLVWMESPGSTTMEVQDIPAIVSAAKSRGIYTGCDNTWATPLLFKPLQHGVDFSAMALTKYVGGHSDLLLGSVAVADYELFKHLKRILSLFGVTVSPDECSLALRGLETMGVRMAHSGRAALEFARNIRDIAGPGSVLHPALPECMGHDIWARDFKGASGVFTIVVPAAKKSRIDQLLTAAETFSIGASWGGTHSLFAPMTIKRAALQNTDQPIYLRVSIGLEDEADLWDDLVPIANAIAS